MNRIVREHYPVERLPEDLRANLAGGATVTVTIDAEPRQQAGEGRESTSSWPELLDRLRSIRASGTMKPLTPEQAVERIRTLRDEWD